MQEKLRKNRISVYVRRDVERSDSLTGNCRGVVVGIWTWSRMIFLGLLVAAMVFALLFPSFAWNISNRAVAARDEGILPDNVTGPNILSYRLYCCGMAADRSGGSCSSFGEGDAVTLNSFDPVLGRNKFTSVFIRLPISGVSASQDLTITLSGRGGLYEADGSGGDMAPYLSNLLEVRCANITTVDIAPNASAETLYEAARTHSAWASAPSDTFVQYSGSGYTTVISGKQEEITLTLRKNTFTVENGVVYVYLKMDYSADLADAFVAAQWQKGGYAAEDIYEMTGLTDTKNDLGPIRLSVS